MTASSFSLRPRRSVLYVPGSNARAIEKSAGLQSDCIIFDLEDSVGADQKAAARDAVFGAVASGRYGDRELIVRINGLETAWGRDDIAAASQSLAAAVLAPKIQSVDDVAALDAALASARPELGLWVMIETCVAVLSLREIAAMASATRLSGFVMGLEDLAVEMRAPVVPGRAAFMSVLTGAVLAARAHGLAILDGVWAAIDDVDGFAAECTQAAAFGFDGKTLVHPAQIAAANAAFAPSPAALDRARAIVAAFEDPANAGKGAIRMGDRMIEPLHLANARRLLAQAR